MECLVDKFQCINDRFLIIDMLLFMIGGCMQFSEKIIKLRKEKGLSQEELGNIINVSRQAISKWETGQAKPEIDKVKELSNAFDLSIDYLLNDKIKKQEHNEHNFNKKGIIKIIFKIFLILFLLYLIIIIYKFSLLLYLNIKTNNIVNYDNYIISIDYSEHNIMQNSHLVNSKVITFENNIEVIEYYEDSYEEPISITYQNFNKNKFYKLDYDDTINKYTYDIIDSNTTYPTIKEITKSYLPNSIMNLFLLAINPKISIYFDNDYLYITQKQQSTIFETYFNKHTGIIIGVEISDNNTFMFNTSYDYIINDDRFDNTYLTEELFLEDIEYIELENLNE